MHLSSFGLISLKGNVIKPKPGLGFADYQAAMANYSATLALKSRLKGQPEALPTNPVASKAVPEWKLETNQVFGRRRPSAASALVRKFRS